MNNNNDREEQDHHSVNHEIQLEQVTVNIYKLEFFVFFLNHLI